MKIGVFDSGVGGLSVAQAITTAFPNDEIIFKNDSKHVPYGSRQPAELLSLVKPIFQACIDEGCVAIVVACNTVTTTIIAELRDIFAVPLIGIEPMIKPASLATKSQVIAVCATPATLQSPRYKHLKTTYAVNLTVLEPDCNNWSSMIEQKNIDQQVIEQCITEVLDKGADVIVLACTHYHWIEAEINQLADSRAIVMQPEAAIIARLRTVLAQLQ